MSWYNNMGDLTSDISDAFGYTQNGLSDQDIADVDAQDAGIGSTGDASKVAQQRHSSVGNAMSKALSGGIGGGAMPVSHAQLTPAAPFHYQSSANGENVVKSLFSSSMQREQQSLNEAGKGFNALTSLNFQ